MPNESEHLDFSLILASAVHDMKNSLSLLVNAVNELNQRYPCEEQEDRRKHAILQYESNRLNAALVQLLGIYKLDNQQLPINLNYFDVDDFLSDQVAAFQPLLEAKSIGIDTDIEEDLDGCFDTDLIATVINNVIGNAIRYTKNKILISAYFDSGLVIEINDDGLGYPKAMLDNQQNFIKSIDYSTGSTGLGLYFAGKIAEYHKKGNTSGSIELANGGRLGGGVFRIRLP